MRMALKWKMNLGPLKEIVPEMRPLARQLVKEMGQKVLSTAKDLCPEDTGALRVGLYMASKEDNGGPEALAAASRLNPKGQTLPLLPSPNSDYLSVLGSAMAYWEHVEYGTGRTPAQPFAEPAFVIHAEETQAMLSKLADMSATKAGWTRS